MAQELNKKKKIYIRRTYTNAMRWCVVLCLFNNSSFLFGHFCACSAFLSLFLSISANPNRGDPRVPKI